MLAYVAVRGGARRDELISMLWGDTQESNARNAFRQSLHRLRNALGEAILPQSRDQVAIADTSLIRVDRDLFLTACENGLWSLAVANYRGEFLEGFETGESAFDRWVDGERVRLRSRFQEALLAAGRQATADGDLREALAFAERLSAVAPYDEEAALFEANTLVAAGRPSQALAALRQFSARLDDDLDIRVSAAVRSLIDRLDKRRDTPRGQEAGSGTARDRLRPSTFVGRESEITRLVGTLNRLKAGSGGTVLIEGESGIGKSRLLDEFADRTRNLGGVLVLRGREAGNGGVVPYAAATEALRPLVRASGVAGASRHLLAEAARLLPELRDSFDLPTVAALEDETGRLRLFEGVAALIDAAAYEKPVCILLDDLQHASPSTLDLLTYLSQRLHESPALFVLAYRPERTASQSIERIRALVGSPPRGDDQRMLIAPLSPSDTSLVVREELSRAGGGNVRDVDQIVSRANGRPMVALDLARRAAQGALASEAPVGLRDILWARLQAASPAQRRVFFACSLFARSTPLRLLAAGAHLPENATWDAADELVRAGLLDESEDGYIVSHDVTANFLVDSSGLAGRALLAGWAADALADDPSATDAELAALYAMAGQGAKAFARARSAAFVASGVGASAEVVRLLGIALTFAPNDGARREIDSLLTAFGRDRLTLPSATHDAPAAATEAVPSTPEAEPELEHLVVDESPAAIEPDVVVEPLEPLDASAASRVVSRAGTARQWIVSVAISIVLILAVIPVRRAITARLARAAASDTLLLVERDANGQNQLQAIANPVGARTTTLLALPPSALGPATWIDSLSAPFTNPVLSPHRQRVALERVTPRGGQVIVVSADRRDTTIVTPVSQDNQALGWSPDGRALLLSRTRTLPDGGLDADLYLTWLGVSGVSVPIDTSTARAVSEAKWSPTGAWIAWVARSGAGAARQRDIYIGRPDGSDVRVIAASPADEYNIDWSPDGSLLAFTSTREGGKRLYVYDFDEHRLWPISDRDDEDHARFSPDGRTIAFESTRDGDRAIYERPALGGTPRRLTPPGRQLSIDEWRGSSLEYLDRLRLVGATSVDVGDTMPLSVLALTPSGATLRASGAEFKLLDDNIAAIDTGRGAALDIVGRLPGTARVVTYVPGWRSDTLTVLVSSPQSLHVADDFHSATLDPRWIALGDPAPYVASAPSALSTGSAPERALFPNGDLEWDSGVLLQPTLQLRAGSRVQARVFAPFTGRPSAARLTFAFVAATARGSIDRSAPQVNPVIGVQWDGASGNFTYSVGQESFSEPAAALGANAANHVITIAARGDSVSFLVDGVTRWQSSLTYLGAAVSSPAQLWIGGRATGATVAVSNVVVDLAGRTKRR
jgi:Tol biopolymer transport system component/DNA-binding SARP family transcriptional activator